ncbi:uncharacterized protein THITE_134942 [Thermothielavioides terrestris NRRL 8126]|uniref:RNA polymerase II subunit B1 CTD phosphatase RPAP2 homolog n=1 Tax=Thermothielavioides terrestris (strain ATCC 38088 / NRRL 8126) TaxID=578455 RepID=G2RDA6_THETT|nr:uncharacterized protein THITE_134942 [Thermothielavioides terrestris NRRL 8126]AEO70745.1 hypothetical protein THITE_134942 [Thermothielavioides terrestris NRRL 8126]
MSAEANSKKKPQPNKPKGILKKPATVPQSPPLANPSKPNNSQPDPSTAARIRLLQKLRDTELKPPVPLSTFEQLIALPRHASPPYSAARPHPADAALFLALLRDFSPAEYLDLVEERNCVSKCGYALCGRPRRALEGAYKLRWGGGGVGKTAELNKWCSDACALRALHLKVQLDHPSYERSAEAGGKMVVKLELREEAGHKEEKEKGAGTEDKNLKEEDEEAVKSAPAATPAADAAAGPVASRGTDEDRERLARDMAQLEIDKAKRARQNASALAAERGDPAAGWLAGQSRVEVTIKEQTVDEPVQPPVPGEDAHLYIEGYKPTFGACATKRHPEEGADSEEDDDEFPTIRL